MYPHRIRLRGPWQCQPAENGGRRYRRRFGFPGRIDAHERVWLTFAGTDKRAVVRLNDCLLAEREQEVSSFEFETTSLLQPRNELVVDVPEGAELGDIAMEIRCTAFLRGLYRIVVRRGECINLCVGGRVVGTAERPLELYVVVGRSTVAYQTITPTTDGQFFEIIVSDWNDEEALSGEGPIVKIELVNSAVVWHSSEDRVTIV